MAKGKLPAQQPVKMIGFFGRPGHYGGKTHVTYQGKPVCGQPLPAESEFQWCAYIGGNLHMVECEKCKAKARKELGHG